MYQQNQQFYPPQNPLCPNCSSILSYISPHPLNPNGKQYQQWLCSYCGGLVHFVEPNNGANSNNFYSNDQIPRMMSFTGQPILSGAPSSPYVMNTHSENRFPACHPQYLMSFEPFIKPPVQQNYPTVPPSQNPQRNRRNQFYQSRNDSFETNNSEQNVRRPQPSTVDAKAQSVEVVEAKKNESSDKGSEEETGNKVEKNKEGLEKSKEEAKENCTIPTVDQKSNENLIDAKKEGTEVSSSMNPSSETQESITENTPANSYSNVVKKNKDVNDEKETGKKHQSDVHVENAASQPTSQQIPISDDKTVSEVEKVASNCEKVISDDSDGTSLKSHQDNVEVTKTVPKKDPKENYKWNLVVESNSKRTQNIESSVLPNFQTESEYEEFIRTKREKRQLKKQRLRQNQEKRKKDASESSIPMEEDEVSKVAPENIDSIDENCSKDGEPSAKLDEKLDENSSILEFAQLEFTDMKNSANNNSLDKTLEEAENAMNKLKILVGNVRKNKDDISLNKQDEVVSFLKTLDNLFSRKDPKQVDEVNDLEDVTKKID